MLQRLFQKMINKKWIVLCILLGLALSVAMASSIPIYTNGVLNRMLTKDLENYQKTTNSYPGDYLIYRKIYSIEKPKDYELYKDMNSDIKRYVEEKINLPVIGSSDVLINDYLLIQDESQKSDKYNAQIIAISGMENNIQITNGSLPSKHKVNGAYEAIVTAQAIKKLNLLVGKEYTVQSLIHEKLETVKVKVVGVFEKKQGSDINWPQGTTSYETSLIIDYDLFKSDYINEASCKLSNVKWNLAFDYHKMNINNIGSIVSALNDQEKLLKEYGVGYNVAFKDTLIKYNDRAKQLKKLLWLLQIPIFIMLLYYIFMTSQLLIDSEKDEIAVLKSRGASNSQIFKDYMIEGIILGCIALVIGPLIGLLVCKVLGASNGFLEFVQRGALPVSLNSSVYVYSIIAVIFFIFAILTPVFFASRTTIVARKQSRSRKSKAPILQRYFIDIILLAISGYGLYAYNSRQSIVKIGNINAKDVPIDPLLFLISTSFIIGLGLFFLRIFPLLIKFIFNIGKKFWPPALYTSLINVGRAGGKNQYVMLFLILSISLGIYNANTARTINNNVEDKIKYSTGADIVLQAVWPSNKPASASLSGAAGSQQNSTSDSNNSPVIFFEPPFSQFEKLSGVENATKVLVRDDASFQAGKAAGIEGHLMGIIPDQFGKVAWFRNGLLPFHWYNYLNLMSKDPRAILVSRSFEKRYGVKVGDSVVVSWGKNKSFKGIIFAFVDYWPTFNPYKNTSRNVPNDLVVANLDNIYAKNLIEPYEVWASKKAGVTSEQLYSDIEKKKIDIVSLDDASQQMIKAKNDPYLEGTNGALTLGFIITILISTIGFLTYWIMSIKERVLQFGILRAMGITMKEIISMLIGEQLMISGTAIIMGIFIGGLTSDLFIPLLQIIYNSEDQVPPFKIMSSGNDYIKLYITVAIMIVVGLSVLIRMIRKMDIGQSLKMGED